MRKVKVFSMMLAGLLAVSGGASAHGDEYLDTVQAPNGGQLRMAGSYHYELEVVKDSRQAKDNPIVVHVTDHAGQKIATAGATGTATILAGKEKATVALAPDGDNRMKGRARYASIPGLKAVVSITLPGKAPEQARFTPLERGAGGHEHGDHR